MSADMDGGGTRDEVRQFVKAVAVYLRPDQELGDDDDLLALGAIDSLGFVELVDEVQSRYGISVEDLDINEDNFGSVTAITRYVEQRRAR
jgi:acyl carrier protein